MCIFFESVKAPPEVLDESRYSYGPPASRDQPIIDFFDRQVESVETQGTQSLRACGITGLTEQAGSSSQCEALCV